MHFFRTIMAAACLAGFTGSFTVDGAENLLKNPGFEEGWSQAGTLEALPDHWQIGGNYFGRYRIPGSGHNIPDRPDGVCIPASGNHAWELAHINGPAGECVAYQPLILDAGKYRFSGKVRTAGNNRKSLRIFVFAGEERRWLDDVPDNGAAYSEFTADFRIGTSGVYRVGIGVFRSEAGYTPYAHWDDLSFSALEFFPDRSSDAVDSDHDGWIDRLEKQIGTDPLRPDSNSSGLPDAIDPSPLLPATAPKINYIAGEKRYADFPVPRNFFWISTLMDYPRDVQNQVLSQFEKWCIYPSIGNGNAPHVTEAFRKRGIRTDGWQCVHERRSFGDLLGKGARCGDYDNPALSAVFAVDQQRKFKSDIMSLVDENNWCPEHYNRESFVAFLVRKGYQPTDFGAFDWESVVMPDITRPRPESRRGRALLRELQYYAEQSSLNHFQQVAFAFKQSNPNVDLNLGIFAPWGLGFGYYANLPVTSLWQIREAALTEWDFYDWVYTGHTIPWDKFNIVEAGNQYLTDLLRIPTQLTFSLEFEEEGRDANFYRLIMMSNLLLVDNITGVTFFYYGVPTAIGPATLDNPRWGWVGEGVKTATGVYPAVHRLRSAHRILIVSDDPLNMGENSMFDENGKKREDKDFLKGINYGWYFRSYDAISKAGYDADFCIPRMVPGLDLAKYDMIVVDADMIPDYPLARLKEWGASGKGALVYHPKAAQKDDLGFERREPWAKAAAYRLPDDAAALKKLLAEKLPREVFTPLVLPTQLRINVRGEAGGDKVVVLANYSDRKQEFSLRLKGTHTNVKSLLGNSHATLKGAVLSGTVEPWQFEVLELPHH